MSRGITPPVLEADVLVPSPFSVTRTPRDTVQDILRVNRLPGFTRDGGALLSNSPEDYPVKGLPLIRRLLTEAII